MPRRPPDRKNKRRTVRIEPYLAPCRITVGRRSMAGYVTNLSPRGARVSCDEQPPSVGQSLTLEIRLKERAAATKIRAEARWVRPATDATELPSFGVRFTGIPAAEREAVEAVLGEFRKRAAMLLGLTG